MSGLLLHELGSADGMEAPARALVVILFAAGKNAEQALAFAPKWRPSVPQTAFVGIELAAAVEGTDIAALQRTAAVAATARSIRMSQIILLRAGAVGRFAVDFVLRGAIPAMGAIGLDIPPCPPPTRIVPTPAKVRLVRPCARQDPPPSGVPALV